MAPTLTMRIWRRWLLSRHGLNGIPVAYRFPVGHVVGNYPMIEGAQVELRVGKDMVELHTIEY